MISFRASTVGSPAGDVGVSITVPAQVWDGDLLLVAIAIPAAAPWVATPPEWTLLRRVDNGTAISIETWWRVASCDAGRVYAWLGLGAPYTVTRSSVLVAYSGTDHLEPFDAEAGNTAAASTLHPLPAHRTSEANARLVGFFAGATTSGDTYVPPSQWTERAQQNDLGSAAILAADFPQAAAGYTAPLNAGFNPGAGESAVQLVALRPAMPELASAEDARAMVVSLLPPGAESLYDLATRTSNISLLFDGLAEALRTEGMDFTDLLRLREVFPLDAVSKIPDWENALGISLGTAGANRSFSTADRRAAIVGKWREWGAASLANLRAAVAPLLGYTTAQDLRIVETDRSALTTAHTRQNATGGVVPAAPGSLAQTIAVGDWPQVSAAGLRLDIVLTTTDLSVLSATLVGPVGTGTRAQASLSWSTGSFGSGGVAGGTVRLYGKAAAGCEIDGEWTLTISNAGATTHTLVSWSLFVEGARRSSGFEGLGRVIFEWAVVADPAKVGATPDYVGAQQAIERLTPGFAKGYLVKAPPSPPSAAPGNYTAIPDDPTCIPNACIPG